MTQVSLVEQWKSHLMLVDEVPAAEAVIAPAADFLSALGASCPSGLDGLEEKELWDVEGAPTNPMVRALLRRACRGEAARAALRSQSLQVRVPAGSDGPSVGALGVAEVLAPAKKPIVNVGELLDKAGLGQLPFHLQPDVAVFQTMWTETAAARAAVPPRAALTYVDLTSKDVLPLWLTPEAIGGKSGFLGEDEALDGDAKTMNLNMLAQALKSATASPRFFRSVSQWSATFLRFGSVAVATQQWEWSDVITHHDTIAQVADQERGNGMGSLIAVLYDDLVRKSWSMRVDRGDSTFKLAEAVTEVDKPIMAAARARFDQVLKAAGLKDQPRALSGDSRASEAESYMAKQSAAMDALTKKASEATKALARAQERAAPPPPGLVNGANSGKGGGKSSGSNKGGGGNEAGYENRRDRKRREWFQNREGKRRQPARDDLRR